MPIAKLQKEKIKFVIEKFVKEENTKIEEMKIVEHTEIAVKFQLRNTPGIVIDRK